MHYYAKQSPRGFANEVIIHRFKHKAARDAWVALHWSDGDVNSCSCGPRPITAKEASWLAGKEPLWLGCAEADHMTAWAARLPRYEFTPSA